MGRTRRLGQEQTLNSEVKVHLEGRGRHPCDLPGQPGLHSETLKKERRKKEQMLNREGKGKGRLGG